MPPYVTFNNVQTASDGYFPIVHWQIVSEGFATTIDVQELSWRHILKRFNEVDDQEVEKT